MKPTEPLTYKQVQKYARSISVNVHAVHRYRSRVSKIPVSEVVHKLKTAYLRGKELLPESVSKVVSFLKYKQEARYFKYGNVIVVATKEERYSEMRKKILTCYLYTKSKFDEKNKDE